MRFTVAKGLLISMALTALCGCASLVKPSDETRHASYAKIRDSFTGDQVDALRQTFMVFSGDSKFWMTTLVSKDGKAHFTFTSTGTAHRGLAVALEADGYLLTAGHVVHDRNFVLGWFDGKVALYPARVVYRSDSKMFTDVAVLKVDGRPDHCSVFGDPPKAGDRAYAVACYHKDKEPDGMVDFAGGTVLKVTSGPARSAVNLVESDVPLWHGDSGGPLLSKAGRLIGVFTAYDYTWYFIDRKHRTTSFLPDQEFIRGLIAADRAR